MEELRSSQGEQNVEDFDLTLGSHSARSEALDSLLNLVNLRLLDFFLHGWTANSISIDDDLVRAFSFVSFTILLEGFQNEVLENLCSPYRVVVSCSWISLEMFLFLYMSLFRSWYWTSLKTWVS